MWFIFFFFNDTATTEIYTLSLHDALPISVHASDGVAREVTGEDGLGFGDVGRGRVDREVLAIAARRRRGDRKSTRLNSSHQIISYAVFCLKKKKKLSHSLLAAECRL